MFSVINGIVGGTLSVVDGAVDVLDSIVSGVLDATEEVCHFVVDIPLVPNFYPVDDLCHDLGIPH